MLFSLHSTCHCNSTNTFNKPLSPLPSPVADAVVCRDLTLGILLPPNVTLSCVPVAKCGTSQQDFDFEWQIRYSSDDSWMTLQSGLYIPPESTGLVSEDEDNLVSLSDGDMTLSIVRMTDAMVGYYRVQWGEMTLSSFTVFRESFYILCPPFLPPSSLPSHPFSLSHTHTQHTHTHLLIMQHAILLWLTNA